MNKEQHNEIVDLGRVTDETRGVGAQSQDDNFIGLKPPHAGIADD